MYAEHLAPAPVLGSQVWMADLPLLGVRVNVLGALGSLLERRERQLQWERDMADLRESDRRDLVEDDIDRWLRLDRLMVAFANIEPFAPDRVIGNDGTDYGIGQ